MAKFKYCSSVHLSPSPSFSFSFSSCCPAVSTVHRLSFLLSRSPFFLASVPAEWVAGVYSLCPFSSPLFHHCQSTELTWVFGCAWEGWNFVEEAPANLALNAAFPPNWNPNGWQCFSWELRAMRPSQPPCSAHLSSKLPVPDLNSGWDVWKNRCFIFLYVLTVWCPPPSPPVFVFGFHSIISLCLSFFLFPSQPKLFHPSSFEDPHTFKNLSPFFPFTFYLLPSFPVFVWSFPSWPSKITEIWSEILSQKIRGVNVL